MLPARCPQGEQPRLGAVQFSRIMIDKPFELADRACCFARFNQGPLDCFGGGTCGNRQRVLRGFKSRQAANPFGGTRRLGQGIFHAGLFQHIFGFTHGLGDAFRLHQQGPTLCQDGGFAFLRIQAGELGHSLGQPFAMFDGFGMRVFKFLTPGAGLRHRSMSGRAHVQKLFIACKLVEQTAVR